MKTKTPTPIATPLTVITDERQAGIARARLLVFGLNLQALDDEIADIAEQRGDALNATDIGVDGAAERAEELGLWIAERESQQADIGHKRQALQLALDRWEDEVREREGAAAEIRLAALAERARIAEQDYAEHVAAAGLLANELRTLHRQMVRCARPIFVSGRPVGTTLLPRVPGDLLHPVILGGEPDPEAAASRWLNGKRFTA